MYELLKPMAEWAGAMTEAIGIFVIAGFSLYSLIAALLKVSRKIKPETIFQEIREVLGRGILLGLEFLVAADIIHTVAVELTIQNVGTLALVVLIRTFLSFAVEVELTGTWPWQHEK